MADVLPREMLDTLAEKRDRARRKLRGKRMTFDCYNARTVQSFIHHHGEGELRVECSQGGKLTENSADGTAFIAQVLRGAAFSNCQECEEYDGGEEAGG